MRSRFRHTLLLVALLALTPTLVLALTPYYQDFESLPPMDGSLNGDGWLIYGNVFDSEGGYMYGHGPWGAPNNQNPGNWCDIAGGQGGDDQGLQQLVFYSDFANADHGNGNLIESNLFQEQTIGAEDVGQIWTFSCQVKRGDITGASEAMAFIKTLDPANGWDLTNLITEETTEYPETWSGLSISLYIDEGLAGQIFQFGFLSNSTLYEPCGMIYDNILLEVTGSSTGVQAPPRTAALGANYPNPFNPSTSIALALDEAQMVDLAVYDLSGRRVATLHNGVLDAGEHQIVWRGRTDTGATAAAGQYRYVMTTPTGRSSRSMVLLK